MQADALLRGCRGAAKGALMRAMVLYPRPYLRLPGPAIHVAVNTGGANI